MENKSRKGLLMAALICGTITSVLGGASVFAAEADDVDAALSAFNLDPIVVTSQRRETTDLTTPATVTVVSEQKIQEAGYKNVFDAIEHQVGLASTGYGDAGQDFGFSAGRTVIRGYDRGTLVMVDGIPMNLKNYNSLDGIPIDMVKKIEVIKGASGTLYGAEAMGGVINIITKRPSGKPQFKVKGTVGNYYKDYGVTFSSEKITASFQKEYSDSIHPSNAYNRYDKVGKRWSSYDWWIGKGQKNRAAVAANITDELSANFMFQDGHVTRGSYDSKKYNYIYQDRRITTGLHYEGKDNGIKATVGYNYRQVDGFDFTGNKKVSSNADLKSYIVDVQKNWEFGNNALIAGYTFKREDYKSLVTPANKAHRTNNALYLSYDHAFSNKFSTTLGLRAEFIDDPFKDQHVFNPQIQTLYKFNDSTSWYVNIGKAFQMPTVDSYFGQKGAVGELDPEKGWTYETGVKKFFGEDKSLKLAVYHMDFENKIGWTPKGWDPADPEAQHAYNAGEFKNTGVEIEYAQKVNDHWDFSAALGLSNPKIKSRTANATTPGVYTDGTWVQDSARIDGSLSATYRIGKFNSTLSWKYLGDREDYSTHGQVPYRSRLTLNSNYNFTKNDTLTLTLNNLTDRENFANKYANYELPFNWKLMYSHTF